MKSLFIAFTSLTLIAFGKISLYEIQGNNIICFNITEKLNHNASEQFLNKNSIQSFSFKFCTDRFKPECTSFDQINCATICYIAKYKKKSNCSCRVTAGTEIGHPRYEKSHFEGYRLNIALTNCHNDFINTSFKRIANRYNGAPQYLDLETNNIFSLSGNSYEILVNQC